MELKDAVRIVLDDIDSGMMFDSHFIINQLIKDHSDEYLRFAAQYADTKAPTLRAHQEIGKTIKAFNNDLVQKQPQPSLSENIHCTASECALWLKL